MITYKCGGNKGVENLVDFDNTAIEIWGDAAIDSIRAEGQIYGGNGGKKQISFTLPTNGAFEVKQLQAGWYAPWNAMVLTYIDLEIDGDRVSAGGYNVNNATISTGSCMIRIISVSHGAGVDAIQFEIVE